MAVRSPLALRALLILVLPQNLIVYIGAGLAAILVAICSGGVVEIAATFPETGAATASAAPFAFAAARTVTAVAPVEPAALLPDSSMRSSPRLEEPATDRAAEAAPGELPEKALPRSSGALEGSGSTY